MTNRSSVDPASYGRRSGAIWIFARRFFRRMDRIRLEGAVGCAANDGGEDTVRVTMFSRPGCHLCDSAADVIHGVRRRREFQFEVVNIEDDPALESMYGTRIPVIHIDGKPGLYLSRGRPIVRRGA